MKNAEESLIEALLVGDTAAVETVRSWLRSALQPYHSTLAGDAEDIEQDVLVDFLDSLAGNRFRGASSLRTYATTFARYKVIDWKRARSRRPHVPIEDVSLTDESATPFEKASYEQRARQVERVLGQLPTRCRDLIAMLEAGLSYAEMAERTGVTPTTLRSQVLRCRRSAAAILEKLEKERNAGGSRTTR